MGGIRSGVERLRAFWQSAVDRLGRPHPGSAALRATLRGLGVLVVAVAGVTLAVLLAGRVRADVGPFHADFAITPGLHGGTQVQIPPLGSLQLHSHAGPAHLVVRLDSLDQQRTKDLVTNPDGLTRAGDTAAGDVNTGVRRLALQVAGVSVLGALILGAVVYRSARRIAQCGALALAIVATTGATAAFTFRADSVLEPRYDGLLTNAPAVIGDARRIAGQYDEYRAELQRLVENVSKLYGAFSNLPVSGADKAITRVLHISDMHLSPAGWSVVLTTVQQFNVDLVIDTGDITDWGSEPEASYVDAIAALKVPYVFIRGNHDSAATAAGVARQPNAIVLDNAVTTVHGLTIAGIGDPRFTPDKSADSGDADTLVAASGRRLAETITGYGEPVDIALVHDPGAAGPLAGRCPLILAGHTHQREIHTLEAAPGTPVASRAPASASAAALPINRSLLMVQGSTGGAGLRGLEHPEPQPLELSVLYFDSTHTLQAYDDIQVGGTGQTEVTLQRHLVRPAVAPTPSGSPSSSGSPAPAGVSSPAPGPSAT